MCGRHRQIKQAQTSASVWPRIDLPHTQCFTKPYVCSCSGHILTLDATESFRSPDVLQAVPGEAGVLEILDVEFEKDDQAELLLRHLLKGTMPKNHPEQRRPAKVQEQRCLSAFLIVYGFMCTFIAGLASRSWSWL